VRLWVFGGRGLAVTICPFCLFRLIDPTGCSSVRPTVSFGEGTRRGGPSERRLRPGFVERIHGLPVRGAGLGFSFGLRVGPLLGELERRAVLWIESSGIVRTGKNAGGVAGTSADQIYQV